MRVGPRLHHVGPGDGSQPASACNHWPCGQPDSVFDTGSEYMAQICLELVALLPQKPHAWAQRHELPSLAFSTPSPALAVPPDFTPTQLPDMRMLVATGPLCLEDW